MLSSKNKAELKRIAHSEDLVKINIGKDLLTNSVIESIENCFSTHELIKISFLKSALANKTKQEFILDLISNLDCDVIQIIGNTAIIYRENKALKNHIILSR